MKYVVTGFYWGKIILITVVLLLSYANLFFFFVLDQEYFTLILLVYPAFSHDSNRNVQFYIEKLYLSDYVGNRGNCAIVTCKITWLQKGVELIYRTQNRAFGMTLVPSLGNNLHKWVFHKVSRFELFEKHTATNYFQIEREQSYDFL